VIDRRRLRRLRRGRGRLLPGPIPPGIEDLRHARTAIDPSRTYSLMLPDGPSLREEKEEKEGNPDTCPVSL
jgi:hypothetical protein